MINIPSLLQFAVEKKASDLHLAAGLIPKMRLNGDLQDLPYKVLEKNLLNDALQALMSPEQQQQFKEKLEIDFSFSIIGLARFRVNLFQQMYGVAAVFRIIPDKILSLEDLHAPDIFQKICRLKHGLVLITGSTGSGKSTTMAAIIDYMNNNLNKHIITIEDPIEFIHSSKKSIINQREVGSHTRDFSHALRATLREDPDVILVGEMRDLESIRLAITAAETGHLVISTLHTNSAQETIDRLINVFPAGEQNCIRSMLSLSLQAVISQLLLNQKENGRVAAYEVMLVNTAIRNLIRENKIYQIYSVIQTGSAEGMLTREHHIKQLVSRGITLL